VHVGARPYLFITGINENVLLVQQIYLMSLNLCCMFSSMFSWSVIVVEKVYVVRWNVLLPNLE